MKYILNSGKEYELTKPKFYNAVLKNMWTKICAGETPEQAVEIARENYGNELVMVFKGKDVLYCTDEKLLKYI